MIDNFLIFLMLIGTVPVAILIWLLVLSFTAAQEVNQTVANKRPVRVDSSGFEEISMPKRK